MTGILCAVAGMGGGGAPVIAITNDYIFYRSGGALSANAAYRLSTDGLVYAGRGATFISYISTETWNTVPATVGNYEARATSTSGDAPTGGTLNSWLSLASIRTWTMQASPGNSRFGDILVEIRDAVSLVVLTSATITLEADAT